MQNYKCVFCLSYNMGMFENEVKDSMSRGDYRPFILYGEVETVTSDTTASHGTVVLADATSGDLTITLPEPLSARSVIIKRIDSTGNVVTINTQDSQTIDGSSSITINTQYVSREIVSDEEDYYIV